MAKTLMYRMSVGLGLIVVLSGAGQVARGQCPEWSVANLIPGIEGGVAALLEFDDGTGSALYAGGSFTTAGGITANRIAKWDGTNWAALIDVTTGKNGVTGIATVRALTVFDDGTGPALYVGGIFTEVGGAPAINIARWDGANWSALGPGLDIDMFTVPENLASVHALTVFDDGTGPALYAGGNFDTSGPNTVSMIARWDPMFDTWSALNDGLNMLPFACRQGFCGPETNVFALTVFDDGSGPALYADGNFSISIADPFTPLLNIARWDGSTWEPLEGGGVENQIGSFTIVFDLIVHDDGTGTGDALYIGGAFSQVVQTWNPSNRFPARDIARWDASGWSALGVGALGPGGSLGRGLCPTWPCLTTPSADRPSTREAFSRTRAVSLAPTETR